MERTASVPGLTSWTDERCGRSGDEASIGAGAGALGSGSPAPTRTRAVADEAVAAPAVTRPTASATDTASARVTDPRAPRPCLVLLSLLPATHCTSCLP